MSQRTGSVTPATDQTAPPLASAASRAYGTDRARSKVQRLRIRRRPGDTGRHYAPSYAPLCRLAAYISGN